MFDVIAESGVLPLIVAFSVSCGFCSLFVFAPQLFLNEQHMQNDLNARQAQHKRPTPRIGGAAVIAGVFVACIASYWKIQNDLIMALIAGVVVFLVGLREDIQRDMSPRVRLVAALASAALAIIVSGATVPRLGIPYVDGVMGFMGVSVLITLLWSTGACHALNLIDGLNGLASGYSMMATAAYFTIGGLTGSTDVQLVAAILFVALLGFFVWNWPYGRVFLGDAGAYAIGHVLSWLGIILLFRDPAGAGFAVILILFWPVADTAFAIIRRHLLGKSADQPDRLHFHHLAVRALGLLKGKEFNSDFLNSLATVVLFPFVAAPVIAGVIFWESGLAAFAALMFFALLFVSTYAFSVDYFKNRRFSSGELPEIVQEQLTGHTVELSDLSGLFVNNSQATYVNILRHSNCTTWSLFVSNETLMETEVYDGFGTDIGAWEYFCEKIC